VRRTSGHTACVVIAFDYEGYPAEENSGCGPLSSAVAEGRRFADLAGASRAEVLEFYDVPGISGNLGFPEKCRVVEELQRLGEELCGDDTLVVFFAGHSTQTRSPGRASGEGLLEDALCFVKPDGSPDFLPDGELAELICRGFHPQTRMLFVVQCCQGSGCVIDLSSTDLSGRPICYMSAVQDQPGTFRALSRSSTSASSAVKTGKRMAGETCASNAPRALILTLSPGLSCHREDGKCPSSQTARRERSCQAVSAVDMGLWSLPQTGRALDLFLLPFVAAWWEEPEVRRSKRKSFQYPPLEPNHEEESQREIEAPLEMYKRES